MSSLPVVKSCSGHGTYENGVCNCDSGWTSLGDFNPVDGLDCGINKESVVGLAWTSLVLGGPAQIIFLYYLIKLIRSRTKMESTRTRIKFMIFYSIQTLMCNIYDIVAVINHEEGIYGQNIWITIFMSIAYFTAYGGCVVYFEVVMKLLNNFARLMSKESQEKVAQSIKGFYALTNALYLVCFLCSLIPLVGLVIDADKCYIVGKACLLSWEIFHAMFLYAFNPPMSVIRNELSVLVQSYSVKNLSDKSLKSANSNLFIAQVSINFLLIFTSIVYVIFACWDYLSRKLVYVILYCTIGVHILSFPMLLSLTYKTSDSSDVSQSRVHATSKFIDSTVYNVEPFDETSTGTKRFYDEEDTIEHQQIIDAADKQIAE